MIVLMLVFGSTSGPHQVFVGTWVIVGVLVLGAVVAGMEGGEGGGGEGEREGRGREGGREHTVYMQH